MIEVLNSKPNKACDILMKNTKPFITVSFHYLLPSLVLDCQCLRYGWNTEDPNDYLEEFSVPEQKNVHFMEHEALYDLYLSTNGIYWTHNWNFTSKVDGLCHCYGVTCDEDHGYVVVLDLSNNNLTGTIPETFKALTKV